MKNRRTAQIDRPVPSTLPKNIAKESLQEFKKSTDRDDFPRSLATFSPITTSYHVTHISPWIEHFRERKIDDLYPDVLL